MGKPSHTESAPDFDVAEDTAWIEDMERRYLPDIEGEERKKSKPASEGDLKRLKKFLDKRKP